MHKGIDILGIRTYNMTNLLKMHKTQYMVFMCSKHNI